MENTEKTQMSTLSGCMNRLNEEGFKENFVIKHNALGFNESEETYRADQVKIVNFYRFEGESDPSDNAILYGIETEDGKKGVLLDAYGVYADEKISRFIKEVEDIHKKTEK